MIYYRGWTGTGHQRTGTVLRTIRALVGGETERVLYECRHCGASVDGAGDRCPDCGAAEVAQFVF